MLKLIKEREYEPDDPETLLAAFKVILTILLGFLWAVMAEKALIKNSFSMNASLSVPILAF